MYLPLKFSGTNLKFANEGGLFNILNSSGHSGHMWPITMVIFL
jgi:hypothetical protein